MRCPSESRPRVEARLSVAIRRIRSNQFEPRREMNVSAVEENVGQRAIEFGTGHRLDRSESSWCAGPDTVLDRDAIFLQRGTAVERQSRAGGHVVGEPAGRSFPLRLPRVKELAPLSPLLPACLLRSLRTSFTEFRPVAFDQWIGLPARDKLRRNSRGCASPRDT